ncbi:MAG TPA: hypothetical protein VH251_01130 [Verrucomicrobiae bacterium]|nr:hypothetical protein [Verrucomicrobiae bacterium]
MANRRHNAIVAAGRNPTLADVQAELFHLDGLRLTETDVAGLLLGEPLDAGRRGLTATSAVADAATRNAARASRLAEDSDCDTGLHEEAAQAHFNAASLHAASTSYHRLQREYHSNRSKANPTPADASAAGLEAALEDRPKKLTCPDCQQSFELESADEKLAATHVTCPHCNARVDVTQGSTEVFNEAGERLADTAETSAATAAQPAELELCCARSLPSLLDDGELSNVIAYMPGGVHQINPSQGGKPVSVTVLVNPKSADTLERQRQTLEAGGNKPFFSVQHSTQIAAFWPSRFFWDTRPDATGKLVAGVYAEGEWSQAGREAVQGKNFRTFSPTFFVDAIRNDPDNPVEVVCNPNAKLNCGALENDPAFFSIPPLWVSQPQPRA